MKYECEYSAKVLEKCGPWCMEVCIEYDLWLGMTDWLLMAKKGRMEETEWKKNKKWIQVTSEIDDIMYASDELLLAGIII